MHPLLQVLCITTLNVMLGVHFDHLVAEPRLPCLALMLPNCYAVYLLHTALAALYPLHWIWLVSVFCLALRPIHIYATSAMRQRISYRKANRPYHYIIVR